ncbi:hypothetical protein D3C79_729570 [compost metagenome]
MATGQTVTEPLTEEQIELGFFVRLVHRRIRIGIDAAKTPGVLGADHFGHARIVIHLHFQLRHRQPWQAVFLAHAQGGGVGTGEHHIEDQHAEHLVTLGHADAARTHGAAHVRQQAHQARIVGLAGSLQPDQIDPVAFAQQIHDHSPLTSSRFKASHCKAIMDAALAISPSRTACKASSNAQTLTRISSPSSSSPCRPPAPTLLH